MQASMPHWLKKMIHGWHCVDKSFSNKMRFHSEKEKQRILLLEKHKPGFGNGATPVVFSKENNTEMNGDNTHLGNRKKPRA